MSDTVIMPATISAAKNNFKIGGHADQLPKSFEPFEPR
jgi:hypothetical protein